MMRLEHTTATTILPTVDHIHAKSVNMNQSIGGYFTSAKITRQPLHFCFTSIKVGRGASEIKSSLKDVSQFLRYPFSPSGELFI
jgi:hypothetical protein